MHEGTEKGEVVVLAETCQVRRAGTAVALLLTVDPGDTVTVRPGEPLLVLAILDEPKRLARGVWLATNDAGREQEHDAGHATVADLSERRNADPGRAE